MRKNDFYDKPFEQKKDTGRLMATKSKATELSPDYWGEVAIDIKDLTGVDTQNGLHIFRLSGWKKRSTNGSVYLSVAVNRYVAPDLQTPAKTEELDDGSDLPF